MSEPTRTASEYEKLVVEAMFNREVASFEQ